MRVTCITLPQGPSLRSGFCCPGPSTLTWPHPSHLPAQRDFAAERFIRAAFAVRERLGDRRVVPCFHCAFRLDMPPSTTPGSSPAAHAQLLDRRRWPSHDPNCSALPTSPQSAPRGPVISGLHRFTLLRPVDSLASLADPTGSRSQPTETFTPGLPTSRSPFPSPSMTTMAAGQLPSAGLPPAGTAASIAALGCENLVQAAPSPESCVIRRARSCRA
jgi:hypothetical protein